MAEEVEAESVDTALGPDAPEPIEALELTGRGLSVQATVARLENIRTFIANALKPGVDYASIKELSKRGDASDAEPEKRTLLLPGAEKVALYMGLRPRSTTKVRDLGNGNVLIAVY